MEMSSLVGIQPAFATNGIMQVSQTSVESPVDGYLTIQNEWGKTPIYASEITAGQAIPISNLQTGKEYQVSINGEGLYFGTHTIDEIGKADIDLYTIETEEESERSVLWAIEYESEPNNTRNKANFCDPIRSMEKSIRKTTKTFSK